MKWKLALIVAALLAFSPSYASADSFQNPVRIPGPSGKSGAAHTFAFVSHQQPCVVGSTNTCSGTVTGIGAGDLLVIDTQYGNTAGNGTAITCTDTSGGNTYILTSPNGFISFLTASDTGYGALFYVLSSTSGSHTIQCTWTRTGGTGDVFISVDTMEFTCSPACSTVTFDKDAQGAKASSTCNSPFTNNTVSPTQNGELIVADLIVDLGSPSTANSPWTLVTGGSGEYYVLSSSGSVQANWVDTQSTGDSCGSTMGAWK
jgi:hypothetical protein